MRVLITNLFVANNSGSEVVVELLADGLRRAGHTPMVLAPTLGAQADRMRTRGHIVVDRVAALPAAPDVIHAQHMPVALSALAAFPDTPVVYACHSASFEVEAPRLHPQIQRWIAVDDLCRDRCLSRGIPADRLTVIPNAVDLERFDRRGALPEKPRRALLLAKNEGHVDAIRAACAARNIELTTLGPAFGRIDHQIERELVNHDIVFATARMALEAAAVGCAVVVCDGRGFAGLLTAEHLSEWRRLNFGAGLLAHITTQQRVAEAIAAYDARDAAIVTDRLRAEVSLTNCVASHITVYEAALADPRPARQDVAVATASWIEEWVPMARGRTWEVVAREQFGIEAEPIATQIANSEQRITREVARQADQAAERINRDLGTEMARLSNLTANRVVQDLGAQTSTLASQLSNVRSDVSNKAAQLGDRIDAAKRDILAHVPGQPQGTIFSRAWRAAIPHAVRAPLFRFRQRLLGRKAP